MEPNNTSDKKRRTNPNQNPENKRSAYLKSIAEESRYNEKLPGEDEYVSEYGEDDDNEDSGKSHFFHYAFLIISLLIIVAIVVLLIRWQKGKFVFYDPDDVKEDYSTESLDMYAYFDPALNPDYVDDGVMNIVILGDDSIFYFNDETGIPALIANETGANVTALALPGASIGLHTSSYTPSNPDEAFSLFYQVLQLASGENGSYDLAETAALSTKTPTMYTDYTDQLKAIDFDQVDVLVICFGINDYLESIPAVGPVENISEQNPFGYIDNTIAALYSSLTLLNERFPNMQVIYSTPTMFMIQNTFGEYESSYDTKNSYSTFSEYVAQINNITSMTNVSFVDNYFGFAINAENYKDYLAENWKYPNEAGRKLVADHIMSFMYFNKNSK